MAKDIEGFSSHSGENKDGVVEETTEKDQDMELFDDDSEEELEYISEQSEDDIEEYTHDELFGNEYKDEFFAGYGDEAMADEEEAHSESKGKMNSRHNKRVKKNKKKMSQKKLVKMSMIVAIFIGIIICAFALIDRYTPSKQKMSGYAYFGVSATQDVMILVNNEVQEQTALYVEGRLYVPAEFVADKINGRFYYDHELNQILFTTATDIYTYKTNENKFLDMKGETHNLDFPVVYGLNDKIYLDMDYISKVTNMTYSTQSAPNRVLINNNFNEVSYVNVTKNTVLRYRAGIKSDIVEEENEGSKLIFQKKIDRDWAEVISESGFKGYIKTNCVSDAYTQKADSVYSDNIPSMTKDTKISLAWFQATNAAANNNINSYLDGTKGITTISPTWYSITNNSGEMSSLASKAFVDNMHAKGYEVWPLIDDFNTSLDGVSLYSSKSARDKMIHTLISDSKKNGYDGINIDFEKVTIESASHFLQFLRELSVSCRNNKIILSVDNYKSAATFRSFYDLKEQSAFADYIIIMGYDEHYNGSDSGSVASVDFVRDGITGALGSVPSRKLVNAVPFYTRIWNVTEKNGQTTTTSKAVGMQTAIDNLNENGVPAVWDDTTGQYFGSYESGDTMVKIWLEEDRSIEEKMKLIKQYNLAGVAQWKLGLEKKSIWSVIAEYNK